MNDIKSIIVKLILRDRLRQCSNEYKNTYSENEGLVILHGAAAYNYRNLNIAVRYHIFRLDYDDSLDAIMKITNVFIHKNY